MQTGQRNSCAQAAVFDALSLLPGVEERDEEIPRRDDEEDRLRRAIAANIARAKL